MISRNGLSRLSVSGWSCMLHGLSKKGNLPPRWHLSQLPIHRRFTDGCQNPTLYRWKSLSRTPGARNIGTARQRIDGIIHDMRAKGAAVKNEDIGTWPR